MDLWRETPPALVKTFSSAVGLLVEPVSPYNYYMLAKKYRLTHYEFLLAKKTGKQLRSEDFSAIVANNKLEHPRFAVVTSAKLSKRAVVRNKLRRQIYDVLGTKNLPSGDYLLFPRASMLNLTNEEIGFKLDSLLSKLPGLA